MVCIFFLIDMFVIGFFRRLAVLSFWRYFLGFRSFMSFLGSMGVLAGVVLTRFSYWGLGIFAFFLGVMGTLAFEFLFFFGCFWGQLWSMCFFVGPGFLCLFWILYENFYTSNFLNINDLFGYVIYTENFVERGRGTDEEG